MPQRLLALSTAVLSGKFGVIYDAPKLSQVQNSVQIKYSKEKKVDMKMTISSKKTRLIKIA